MGLTTTIKTLSDVTRMVVAGELRLHHRSTRSGYVPKARGAIVRQYKGRFGSGYVVITGIPGDTRRVSYTYYVEKEE